MRLRLPRFPALLALGVATAVIASATLILLPPAAQLPARASGGLADGRIVARHPRILLPELRGWPADAPAAPMLARRDAQAQHESRMPPPCELTGLLATAACFTLRGTPNSALALLRALETYDAGEPAASGDYGGLAWLAIGFDLAKLAPSIAGRRLDAVEARIRRHVEGLLRLLDDDEALLWHGRTSLAAHAWLGAVVLPPDDVPSARLQRRAQAHVLEAFEALQVSEAWPEGFSYWINERALLMALAGAAYINGLEASHDADRVRRVLVRSVRWMQYTTRPDGRVEGLGDEGPRVDLKDEARRAVDVIAQVTRDPAAGRYSAYLRTLHGTAAYYRRYHGEFTLFNDPGVVPEGEVTLDRSAAGLPLSARFGAGATELLVVRSGWGPEDTLLTYRAGAHLSHHGHADAGHFSLYKRAPVAVNAATYTRFDAPNRRDFAATSLSRNTLALFTDSGDPSGAQRTPLADGGRPRRLAEWRERRAPGGDLAAGRVLAFEDSPDSAYVRSELAGAYAGAAGPRSVRRELLYLRDEDRLLVRDRVDWPELRRGVWTLHVQNRPRVEPMRLIRGSASDGVLTTPARRIGIVAGGTSAVLEDLSGAGDDIGIRVVGGPRHRHLVRRLDGGEGWRTRFIAEGASSRRWFDRPAWRIEIPVDAASGGSLVALSLHDDGALEASRVAGGRAVRSAGSVTVFLDSDTALRRVVVPASMRRPLVRIVGIDPDARPRIAGAEVRRPSPSIATLHVDAQATGDLELRW